MYCNSYPLLDKAYQVLLTFSITQVACERTFSKLKYIKNRLRNQLSDQQLDALLLMCIEREILSSVTNEQIIDEVAKYSTEMGRLLCL